ncbi:hypothetical protein [Streptomyces sp. NPDC056227]
MTWPTARELIAAAIGVIAVLMICASQRGGPTPQDPPDGDKP